VDLLQKFDVCNTIYNIPHIGLIFKTYNELCRIIMDGVFALNNFFVTFFSGHLARFAGLEFFFE